jgi:hypothetical protein
VRLVRVTNGGEMMNKDGRHKEFALKETAVSIIFRDYSVACLDCE